MPIQQKTFLRIDKFHSIVLLILFILCICLYWYCMPKDIALEDDGLFAMAADVNGLSHPPGYPLYTLIAHFVIHIPIAEPATRLHALSAVFGAIAVLLLYLYTYSLFPRRDVALVAAMSLAYSQAFWSQSIIAEVYTLNMCLVLSLLLYAHFIYLRCHRSVGPVSVWHCFFLFILFGLGLANHWPLVLLSTPALFVYLFGARRYIGKHWVLCVIGFVIGLSPYVWMVFRSMQLPEISFSGALTSVADVVNYISRKIYADVDASVTADLRDKLQFAAFFFISLMQQFGLVGALFLLAGIVYQIKILTLCDRLVLLCLFLGNSLVLVVLLNFDYDHLHRAIFSVYPLSAYAVSAVWLALGYAGLCDWLKNKVISERSLKLSQSLFLLLIVLSLLIWNFPLNDRHNYEYAGSYARAVLNSLDANAVLFVSGDAETGAIGYYHHVKGLRSDIELFNNRGLLFANRLFKPHTLRVSEEQKIVSDFIDKTQRPIYYIGELKHNYGVNQQWLVSKVDKARAHAENSIKIDTRLLNYFDYLLRENRINDAWTMAHHKLLLSEIAPLIVQLRYADESNNTAELNVFYDRLLVRLSNYYKATVEMLNALEAFSYAGGQLNIDRLLLQASEKHHQAATKQEASLLYFVQAKYALFMGDTNEAQELLLRSFEVWPTTQNNALLPLLTLYRDNGDTTAYQKLIERYSLTVECCS